MVNKDLINGFKILNNAKYFSRKDGLSNYFIFQPLIKYFKPPTNDVARAIKFIGFSDESLKPPLTLDKNLNSILD